MRTTVELPPAAHARVRELADTRGQSMSRVIADLTLRGLAQLDVDVVYSRDERTGFPVISIGTPVSDEDVAAALDEDA
ncbi:hypothetical protein [Microbacterium sp.]|uniref:hypothetical protein n=1 Tax=Microbacterium sp. TaxID=51671 RepID=UPI003C793937